MTDFIILLILAAILGASVTYIIRSKKRGVKCIGCPDGGECSHKKEGAQECGCHSK